MCPRYITNEMLKDTQKLQSTVYFDDLILKFPSDATVNGTTNEEGVHLFSVAEFLAPVTWCTRGFSCSLSTSDGS